MLKISKYDWIWNSNDSKSFQVPSNSKSTKAVWSWNFIAPSESELITRISANRLRGTDPKSKRLKEATDLMKFIKVILKIEHIV